MKGEEKGYNEAKKGEQNREIGIMNEISKKKKKKKMRETKEKMKGIYKIKKRFKKNNHDKR